MIFADHTYLGN